MDVYVRRRILRGCERKLTGIDGHHKNVSAIFGVGSAVDACRTNGQRTSRRVLPGAASRSVTFDAQIRQLKPNEMLPWHGTEMHAGGKLHMEDGNTAFAGRTASSQYGRQGAIFLRQ